jgi:hypothetical protein
MNQLNSDPTKDGLATEPTVKSPDEQSGTGVKLPDPPDKGDTDWEGRYKASSTEAIRLAEELKRKEELLAELQAKAERMAELDLESELRNSVPDWDGMDEQERELAKDNFRLKREKEIAEAELKSMKDREELNKQLETVVNSSDFKELGASKDEFRNYAEKHPGTDLKVLARSFLFEKAQEKSAKDASAKASLQGVETPGFGGDLKNEGSTEITPEQLNTLRYTDPKAFMEYHKNKVQSDHQKKINDRILGLGR